MEHEHEHERAPEGPRVNRDTDRRDVLLGTRDERYSGGIKPFTGLDAPRALALIEEGFLDPHGAQNHGPGAGAIVRFLVRWPAVRARGYAVSRRRPDYRVTLDGLECDLEAVPEGERDKLRAEFELFCRGADEYVDRPAWLFAWWD